MSSTDTTAPSKQKTALKKKQSQGKTSNLLTNLLLIVSIGLVLFATQSIKQELSRTQQILQKQIDQLANQQVVRPPTAKKPKKNNVMCPNAKTDLDGCLQKQQKCLKTQKQFQAAQKQFTKLIIDCAKSNDQNQKMNEQMQAQVLQMEKDLNQAEKVL